MNYYISKGLVEHDWHSGCYEKEYETKVAVPNQSGFKN